MSIAEKFATMEYGPAPEDPKEALTWLDRHQRQFGHFIDGDVAEAGGGGYFDTSIHPRGKAGSGRAGISRGCGRSGESGACGVSQMASA